jgi:hypothetical protein
VDKTGSQWTAKYINNITLNTSFGLREGYYPANYDRRIIGVINLDKTGKVHSSSNYGAAFGYSAVGTDVLSLGLRNTFVKSTGTSMAVPKITGKIIKGHKKP